ncbi:MAG: DUF3696 domain-containing protein [Bacteroidia bacterium]|nr:DUF3696 domain-containing protein [Bacteroidia bacterium]
MLINSIKLDGFRCFDTLTNINFSKITLLTGANSSGKSTIIKSILLMLQSIDFPFYLSPNGKYINLGDYSNIVNNTFFPPVNYPVMIDAEFNSDYFYPNCNLIKLHTYWKCNEVNEMPELFELSFDSGIFNLDFKLDQFIYTLSLSSKTEQYLSTHLKDYLLKKGTIKKSLSNSPFFSFKNAEYSSLEKAFKDFFFFKGPYVKDSFSHYLSHRFQIIDEHFNFLDSYRIPPERTYYREIKDENKIHPDGKGFADQLIDWQEKDTNKIKLKEFTTAMRDMELFSDLKITKLSGGKFEIKVKVFKSGNEVLLSDAGYGVSKVIPIIVADIQLPENSLLAVSEPELDLHPSAQAKFGDYLAKQINDKKKQKQYLIETHSEYLLNRLRLLIVKGELKPDDVAIYYLENSGKGTKTHIVEFTKDGQIKGAPKGFFETYMIDVMDIAMNAK